MRAAFAVAVAAALAGCAPSGFHYDAGSFTPAPNDECQRAEMTSPGAISILNASVGERHGASSKVTAIDGLQSADTIQLSLIGIRPSQTSNSVFCHATLHYVDGRSKGGVLSLSDPGAYAQVQVEWIDDTEIATKRSEADGLRSGRKLYVQPDLSTPAIQECVGRRTALGVGEEFPGQLWAACAAQAKGDR